MKISQCIPFGSRMFLAGALGAALMAGPLSAADDAKPAEKPKAPATPAPPATPATEAKPAAKEGEPSLDELLGLEKPAGAKEKDAKTPAAKPPAPKPRVDVAEPEEAAGDQFSKAILEMKQSADLLGRDRDASASTQRVQQRVIDRLDQLITLAEQQQQDQNKKKQQQKKQNQQQQDTGQKQNAQQKQNQPGQQDQANQQNQSTQASKKEATRTGQEQKAQVGEVPLVEKLAEWGNLPPRLRKELLQGREDRFSDLYRNLTERFYKRLAEDAK